MKRIRLLDVARFLDVSVRDLQKRYGPEGILPLSAAQPLSRAAVLELVGEDRLDELHRDIVMRAQRRQAKQDALITAAEAAERFHIPAARVRKWQSRGLLSARGTRGRANLYRYGDVETLCVGRDRRTPGSRHRSTPFLDARVQEGTVDTRGAASLVGVSPSTIRMWVARGHLAPSPTSNRGHRFVVGDVLAAARGREKNAMR